MTYDLKQQAKEQGIVLDERCTLDIEDVKHMADYDEESHGELLRVLEEFYDDRHVEIRDLLLEQFQFFLDSKNN
jgi:hypothetical protein